MASIGNHATILKRKLEVASVRKDEDPLKFAHAIRHLGDAYYYAELMDQATPCYLEALEIYRGNNQRRPLDFANAIRSFAGLKDHTGAIEEAQTLWQEAHDIYVVLKIHAGVAETAARLALIAWRQSNSQQSSQWLSEAIAAADVCDDPETQEYVSGVRVQLERERNPA